MKKIEGSPKNLKQLLQNTKYTIHYYQREYRWQRKHIEELIYDLSSEFLENYHQGDPRPAVANYSAYFMGSIVLAGRENAIIDGQQRFSSLTLLLMYLNNKLHNMGQSYNMIETMIFSEAFGSKSFNINVDDRHDCMEAIFNDKPFDVTNAGESVKNLYKRYENIIELFPRNDITDDIILHFCDWLAEKVFFIEIIASTEQDAHKIFVTMNDRGLNLNSTEMLKGYLLSEIKNDSEREKLNNLWKNKVFALKKLDDKGDEIFIKAWLRAQYAETIRAAKAGAVNEDFDIIGGAFHKWVRDERIKLSLNSAEDYELFIKKFDKFSDIYMKIQEAEMKLSDETKYIYYNAQVNFTLQTQLLLAPICYDDDWSTITIKMNLVARFIDLLIITRITNYRSLDYSTIKNYIFNLTKNIRRCSVADLKSKLKTHYDELQYDPKTVIPNFGLNNFTKRYIKHMLARITSFIEEQTDIPGKYCDYMNTQTKNPFEIEHIISNHYDWFKREYADENEFNRYRNKFSALLLLQKSINASLSDKRYKEKLPYYCSTSGNIYSATLGSEASNISPRFRNFVSANGLLFKTYDDFGKIEIDERCDVVIQLVNLIWNSDDFI